MSISKKVGRREDFGVFSKSKKRTSKKEHIFYISKEERIRN